MPGPTLSGPQHGDNLSQGSAEKWQTIVNRLLARNYPQQEAEIAANTFVKPSIMEAMRRRLYG